MARIIFTLACIAVVAIAEQCTGTQSIKLVNPDTDVVAQCQDARPLDGKAEECARAYEASGWMRVE